MNIQSFVLKDKVLETESERRKIILGAYLILMYLGIDFFYFIVNLFNDEGDPLSLFIGVLIGGFCLFLLRWQFINTAIIIHLLRCNFFAFYFSYIDFDPLQTGSYLYFILSSLGALAVFGYREKFLGIGFTLLSYSLFIAAIFKPDQFNPNEAHFYLIVSFLIVLIVGILILIFFDHLVTASEKNILAKNRELIKTNRELDRFVYSASHDLRAPLTSMSGLVNLAQVDPEGAQNYLRLMQERIEVMDNYIKEIVEYSRNARLNVNLTQVPIKKVVLEVVNTLKYSIDTNKVQIEIHVSDSFHIKTDESRLRVILNNLIANAFKYQDYSKPNPFLKIKAIAEDNRKLIQIEDNGIGIKSEYHAKLFEMFYRATDTSTGSGLGLYIAQEAVDKLQGQITFESEFGKGSVFTIILPA
ncbi:MAG: HAMP domain-containing histidine kinase [Cyclobacteriaceae bacterium]|nr:HAMP domain-containing histidine kinase [Cyclobacteriaceae bacterium]